MGPDSARLYVHGGRCIAVVSSEEESEWGSIFPSPLPCSMAIAVARVDCDFSHVGLEFPNRMGLYECPCPDRSWIPNPVSTGIRPGSRGLGNDVGDSRSDLGGICDLPIPSPDFAWEKVGVPETWNFLTGFESHWEKNANIAAWFDRWFLNLFPRAKPFEFSSGGYQTLNFVPSIATMAFGMLCGRALLPPANVGRAVGAIAYFGVVGIVMGVASITSESARWSSGFGPPASR